MSATRFFVAGLLSGEMTVELTGDDARKLLVVLRSGSGDEVEIVDSAGRAFAGVLQIEGSCVRAVLGRELAAPPRTNLSIVLAQGIPKGAKMDFVVEKATELGVERVLPFTSERTVGETRRAGKLERWRRLARSASQQCGRREILSVGEPQSFGTLIATFATYDVALVPWEVAEAEPLRDVLPPLLARAKTALVTIGPEGGLSHAEARAAQNAGGHLISLGSRILRTETAGLVACSALRYAAGDL